MASFAWKVTILGRMRAIAIFRAEKKRLDSKMGSALEGAGQAIMSTSRAIYVPVATGQLMGTGRVGKASKHSGNWEVEMMYGGQGVAYATNVHETNRSYGGGRVWKYLTTPAQSFNYDSYMVGQYLNPTSGIGSTSSQNITAAANPSAAADASSVAGAFGLGG